MITLHLIGVIFAQERELIVGLDALGDEPQIELLSQGNHGAGDDLRRNALAARRASSNLMCRVQSSKSTHAGIPWLRFIRQHLGSRVHFWPFDGWDVPAGRSAVAEVYPALWSRSFALEDRGADQHDAYCVAAWLSRADHDGRLAAFLKPDLTGSERTVAEVEGRILGVGGNLRAV